MDVSEFKNLFENITDYEWETFLRENDPEKDPELQREKIIKNIIVISAYSLIFVISLFGNLLVCYVIISKRDMRSITNFYIANLTVSDLLMTLLNIPFNVARLLLDNWPFGKILCQLVPFVQVTSVYVSSITMSVIALDRYQALVHPLRRRLSVTVPIYVMIPLIWLMAGLLSLPHAIFNNVVPVFAYRTLIRCRVILPEPQLRSQKLLTIFTFSTQYLIPLTIACVTYLTIVYNIWNRGRLGAMTEQQMERNAKAKRKSIKMLILVLVVFAVCWFPLNMYHIRVDFGTDPNRITSNAFLGCHWFAMSSVCYNPFIYCWRNVNFRNSAKSFFRCIFTCHCQTEVSNSNARLHYRSQKNTSHNTSQNAHRCDLSGSLTDEEIFSFESNKSIKRKDKNELNSSVRNKKSVKINSFEESFV